MFLLPGKNPICEFYASRCSIHTVEHWCPIWFSLWKKPPIKSTPPVNFMLAAATIGVPYVSSPWKLPLVTLMIVAGLHEASINVPQLFWKFTVTLCVQLTHDLLAIAKFLVLQDTFLVINSITFATISNATFLTGLQVDVCFLVQTVIISYCYCKNQICYSVTYQQAAFPSIHLSHWHSVKVNNCRIMLFSPLHIPESSFLRPTVIL